MNIVTISTSSKGGIKSVVDNYYESGLLNKNKDLFISSHNSENNKLANCFLYVICICKVLVQLLREKKIYHMHMSMRGSFYRKYFLLRMIKLLSNSPVIIHLHGSEFKVFNSNQSKKVKRMIVRNFLMADAVIVLSNSWADYIYSLNSKINVKVVNNFVNPIRSISVQKSEKKIVGFFGYLGERKGIYDIINCLSHNKNEFSDYRFIICGDGEIEKVRKLVQKHRLESIVELAGWVSGTEKVEIMNMCDCILLPSYNEGLPMIILEAMSLGKVVISTSVGGIPEVIEDSVNGFIISPGDIGQLRNKLLLIDDKALSLAISKQAYRTYKDRFSPYSILPLVENIYADMEKKYA